MPHPTNCPPHCDDCLNAAALEARRRREQFGEDTKPARPWREAPEDGISLDDLNKFLKKCGQDPLPN